MSVEEAKVITNEEVEELTPDVDKVYESPKYITAQQEHGLKLNGVKNPCIILESSEAEIGGHILMVLQKILDPPSLMSEYTSLEQGVYNVYIKIPKKMGLIGTLHSHKLRVLFDTALFKCFKLIAYDTEGKEYQGEMLYSLCTKDF